MRKYIMELRVASAEHIHERYVLLKLTDDRPLPDMQPGQFVEVRVDGSPSTFLRRPISIHFVDRMRNELWLLVATIGDGTRQLGRLRAGDTLNCVLPLGRGFSLPAEPARVLLVGGGVGVAPLLFQGAALRQAGMQSTFLLGARTAGDLLMLDEFRKQGETFVTTEDGSAGEKGFVTNHSVLQGQRFGLIQSCGPTPMMKAVARFARENGVECEVSLENLMACGLGACLCCVEKVLADAGAEAPAPATQNVCVCKEGPVFNIKRLLWQS